MRRRQRAFLRRMSTPHGCQPPNARDLGWLRGFLVFIVPGRRLTGYSLAMVKHAMLPPTRLENERMPGPASVTETAKLGI